MTDTILASADTVSTTIAALNEHGFLAESVATGADALARIKELVPHGASVMNGASVTLEQIGLMDYLKAGEHEWNNLHDAILEETDPSTKTLLRRQSVVSDVYLGSAHALTEAGEIMIASNSGSQLPHLAFTSPTVVLVVGAQKIVPTLTDAFARIQDVVIPQEDVRMKEVYGYGTLLAKTLILHKENPALERKVYVLVVNEELGF